MKRKFFVTASMIAVMALSAVGFAACGGNEGTSESSQSNVETSSPAETPATNKVVVTYYDGTNELKSEEVEKGGKATEWTPEKTGYEFMGWYAEASLSQEFSFDTVINEDTDVFSAWRENVYVEDTAAWYFIGAGSGDMSATNWNHEEGLFMTKDKTITDANVYTIEITMYAGDQFQITHSGSWDYQQGIGHMIGFEYAAGVNPCAPSEGEV
ncbi:MAG: InlB B-repeat-containing protein, partial [Clostridia bacterium]|nr:InlB B-repeat-containing protein [Clostridia bacterium]